MADRETQAIRLAAKIWPEHRCRIRVKNTNRGHAYPETREVTIPKWVMDDPRPGYRSYYVAHELAHVHAGETRHNKKFYESFVQLCPKSYQKFELAYKPRNAKSAGITRGK